MAKSAFQKVLARFDARLWASNYKDIAHIRGPITGYPLAKSSTWHVGVTSRTKRHVFFNFQCWKWGGNFTVNILVSEIYGVPSTRTPTHPFDPFAIGIYRIGDLMGKPTDIWWYLDGDEYQFMELRCSPSPAEEDRIAFAVEDVFAELERHIFSKMPRS